MGKALLRKRSQTRRGPFKKESQPPPVNDARLTELTGRRESCPDFDVCYYSPLPEIWRRGWERFPAAEFWPVMDLTCKDFLCISSLKDLWNIVYMAGKVTQARSENLPGLRVVLRNAPIRAGVAGPGTQINSVHAPKILAASNSNPFYECGNWVTESLYNCPRLASQLFGPWQFCSKVHTFNDYFTLAPKNCFVFWCIVLKAIKMQILKDGEPFSMLSVVKEFCDFFFIIIEV